MLFAGIDAAVQNGSRMQADAASGQGNFFDNFDTGVAQEGDSKKAPPREIMIEEWPEDKLLSLEKEVLGTYITGHPFAKYMRTWKKLGMLSSRKHADAQVNSKFRIGGIVRSIQERLTKQGKPFAIITLEDPDGIYELFLSTANYETFHSFLIAGTALLIEVTARLPEGRDRIQMVAKKMQFLDDLVTQDLHILLQPETSNDELHEIRETLLAEKHRGESSVYFHVKDGKRTILVRTGHVIRIHPSEELISSLTALRCVQEVKSL